MNESKRPAWHLGQTSETYETGGRGPATISTGIGDHGGVSYGAYQLSSTKGTLDDFLKQSAFGPQFDGLAPTTPAFDAQWVELSANPAFVDEQHQFIKHTHYEPVLAELASRGMDMSDRGPAVQDAIWSTAVQTRTLAPNLFQHGLEAKFGQHPDLAHVTDKEVVEAVQDYKLAHVETIWARSHDQWEGLRQRAVTERAALIQVAEAAVPVNHAVAQEPPHAGPEVGQVPDLLDARHPAHGIYEQAYSCVARLDEQHGVAPGPHTQTFAGGLTAAATANGLYRVDHVVLNHDASVGYAVQGDLNSPFKQLAEVNVMQAIQTPLAQSSQEAATHVQANAEQQAQALQQQQAQSQQQGTVPGLHR